MTTHPHKDALAKIIRNGIAAIGEGTKHRALCEALQLLPAIEQHLEKSGGVVEVMTLAEFWTRFNEADKNRELHPILFIRDYLPNGIRIVAQPEGRD